LTRVNRAGVADADAASAHVAGEKSDLHADRRVDRRAGTRPPANTTFVMPHDNVRDPDAGRAAGARAGRPGGDVMRARSRPRGAQPPVSKTP
jgi:hypothetical protein